MAQAWDQAELSHWAQGKRENPETYIQKIRDVNVDDINRIATKMLASKPSIAAIGSLDELP